ncbi:MAG: hypothetical protein KGS48_04685 [Bacteroidetes bacterium]|nr:hypothetical protein [Bacteroidota bacterium]
METWGFFAHKRINRLAVLTLPPQMMVFFKPNIDYITDHAVDPDMRRYATRFEAPRHFIDLDNYGPPFTNLPKTWLEAMIKYTDVWITSDSGDTILLYGKNQPVPESLMKRYKPFFAKTVLPHFYDNEEMIETDSLDFYIQARGLNIKANTAFFKEHLSEHGIVPWHLQKMQKDLTEAFRRRDSKRILRLASDFGHYIGDAHVPLHTCSNYNGQKTGQHGIHGFWESRIPELFADERYDFFVGKPAYIENTTDFFWDAVYTSNSMVDSVLEIERALRLSFPSDRQMCPDMRLGVTVLAPCRDFAEAYEKALQGMIERRMRTTIHAVGSLWYTAWVDAGQPDLSKMDIPITTEEDLKAELDLKKAFDSGKIIGRTED